MDLFAKTMLAEVDELHEEHVRVRTIGDAVICRVTIGTVQQVDYAVTSSLAADVAALQDDVAGIDGNLSVATSVQVVESTVTEAIDDLDELADLDF